MEETTTFDNLCTLVREKGSKTRSLTAIAGAPASGKSTLAEALVNRLNDLAPGSAAILPMDGFHYDDAVLIDRGWRARKGAPHTFDVAGFHHMVGRLRGNEEADVAVPVFDRGLEIARAGARIIPASVRHIVVEGNYLLLDEPPWSGLAHLFDTTVFLDVPLDTLEARLTQRWAAIPHDQRQTKLVENDLPNARLVVSKRRPCDYVIRNTGASPGLGST